MDINFSQSSQDEFQEDFIDVENIDNENYDDDPIFNLEQSLYEHALTLQIPCREMALCPAIDQSLYTENTSNSRGVHYICCQCYEKNGGHLHIRMGTGAKKDPGCTAMHLDDIETALRHFAKLIEMVAHSENEVTKKNLLQILILCLENFDLDSSSAPSQLPSLFVSEKHPLFEISDQLTPRGYEHMFTCYNKGVIRIMNIVKQDILKQKTRIAKGRAEKNIIPYLIGRKKAAQNKKKRSMEDIS
ncbi:6130_t:CDS:2 [Cetraspora pellucida]|uniref:6130_t:CDS:1 n=1 Tax=Cetraspora pellucida TaxID=1433469 RepID=A0ACA9KWJ6_9GLOM|nr:6130_t:CDS:2 [Cetraspora pellucida]